MANLSFLVLDSILGEEPVLQCSSAVRLGPMNNKVAPTPMTMQCLQMYSQLDLHSGTLETDMDSRNGQLRAWLQEQLLIEYL